MLGQRRTQSIFAPDTQQTIVPMAPGSIPVEPSPGDMSLVDTPPLTGSQSPEPLEQTGGNLKPRHQPHSLFFAADSEGQSLSEVLAEVQKHIAQTQAELINIGDPDANREHLRRYISKFVQDQRLSVLGMNPDELTDALFTEMVEFGFLTQYLQNEAVEEININSWNCIEVLYNTGEYKLLDEHFDSPEHAVNIVRRMLQVSNTIIDNATPIIQGSLGKNMRIAALKHPVVDEDVAIAASIRRVNQQNLSIEDLVRTETATTEMLEFLASCLQYGISIVFSGSTGSGKTTLASLLLQLLPNHKRLVTIEGGARELNLLRYDEQGRVKNRVVHLLTRESDNENMNITQTDLIEITLRLHPDVVAVSEMRSAEANAAVEMALAGHSVISTLHSNSAESSFRRIVTLCKRGSSFDDDTLMGFACEAFPLVCYVKQLESKQRKVMEILECETLLDGSRRFHSLFRYNVTESRLDENGKFKISGSHERVSAPSETLKKRLLENGMPLDLLEKLMKG